MKKILFSLLLMGFIVFPVMALAQTPAGGTGTGGFAIPALPTNADKPLQLIERITDWIFWILVISAIIVVVLAGFNFVFSGGSADKVKSAQNSLLYAIVGLVVAFLARGIVNFILTQINQP